MSWLLVLNYHLSTRLDSTESGVHVLCFQIFFFFLHVNSNITWFYCAVDKKYCSYTVYILFTGPTTLFTHLKIILLQCFQFSVSATISSIQTEFYLVPLKFLWPLEFATCIKGVIHPKIIIRLVASNFLYTLAL